MRSFIISDSLLVVHCFFLIAYATFCFIYLFRSSLFAIRCALLIMLCASLTNYPLIIPWPEIRLTLFHFIAIDCYAAFIGAVTPNSYLYYLATFCFWFICDRTGPPIAPTTKRRLCKQVVTVFIKKSFFICVRFTHICLRMLHRNNPKNKYLVRVSLSLIYP